ncbi:pilus assembly protein PilM [Butyrivibrio sp. FCS006]|uniref:pilus assembly protein PilM n=1 Tax=Butyrivibrio sp. FCS006 TaxID=1280684 RepID=UPI0003FCA72B|nr:pilus assembly protein PilM [Butyrivibrio sp. FCS006]
MAKTDGILGIDVRHGKLSLSIIRGGKINKTVWVDVPGNIVDDYKILSENLFSEFLKDKMKENKIKAKKAVVVISDTDLVIRSFSMPAMDDSQLKLNVPFEFSDFISGDMKEYIFDYVKRDARPEDASGQVNLIAYAVRVEYIRKVGEALRNAGLKLERAVPETICYETLLESLSDPEDANKERCFLDIGTNHITMRIFRDGDYRLSHIIDLGENKIIQSIADELNCDVNLAETYLRSNYQDCQNCQGAVNAYKDISLEIIKGLNYYDMSDATSKLKDVVLCGPGAMTGPLVALLQERIDKSVYTIQDMFPGGENNADLNVTSPSVIALTSAANGIGILESAAYTDVKKTDWKLVLLGAIAAVAVVVLAVKVGILDKYNELVRSQAYEAELQARVNADTLFIKQAEELSVEYYHYTWDDMTEEEKGRVSRVDVANLADFIVSQGVSVRSINLKEKTLVVGVTGDSLNTMSKLTAALTDLDIVESCSLSMAQKESAEDTNTSVPVSSTSSDEEVAEEDYAVETVDLNSVVNAEINIYLTTLNSEERGGEQ